MLKMRFNEITQSKLLEERIENEVKDVLETAFDTVLAYTPVSSGELVANTRISANAPDKTYSKYDSWQFEKGSSQYSLPAAPLSGEENRGKGQGQAYKNLTAFLIKFNGRRFQFRDKIKFFISNSTPYATDVEYGRKSENNLFARDEAIGMYRKAAKAIARKLKG
jgi:hypothetical protein